jgi:hypothetical protein
MQARQPFDDQGAQGDREEGGLVPEEQRHGGQVGRGGRRPCYRAAHPPGQAIPQQHGEADLGDAEGDDRQGRRAQVRDPRAVHAHHAGRVASPQEERSGRCNATGEQHGRNLAVLEGASCPGDSDQVRDQPAGQDIDPAGPRWAVEAEPHQVGARRWPSSRLRVPARTAASPPASAPLAWWCRSCGSRPPAAQGCCLRAHRSSPPSPPCGCRCRTPGPGTAARPSLLPRMPHLYLSSQTAKRSRLGNRGRAEETDPRARSDNERPLR